MDGKEMKQNVKNHVEKTMRYINMRNYVKRLNLLLKI